MIYIVLNEDKSIHTVSEKNDNVLINGQIVIEQEGSLKEFVSSLPNHPSFCKKQGDKFVYEEKLKDKRTQEQKDADNLKILITDEKNELLEKMAIESLKSKGKLDSNGKIKKL